MARGVGVWCLGGDTAWFEGCGVEDGVEAFALSKLSLLWAVLACSDQRTAC